MCLQLLIGPFTVTIPVAGLKTDPHSTTGSSTIISSANVPSINFYAPINSTSDLQYIDHANMSRGLHCYIIVL